MEYEVVLRTGETILIDSPAELPDEGDIAEIREPWMKIEIFSPTEFYGPIMELATSRRGIFQAPGLSCSQLRQRLRDPALRADRRLRSLEIQDPRLRLAGLPVR